MTFSIAPIGAVCVRLDELPDGEMTGSQLSFVDIDQSALWRDELWFIERTTRIDWRDPENSANPSALKHVHLAELSDAGPAFPLEARAIGSG